MTGMRILRLLAIVALVVIVISLVTFVGASSVPGPGLPLLLTGPGTQLLLATVSGLGFATGIAAIVFVAQQRRWGWLVAVLLLVLVHMYAPVVVLNIGPSQGWWGLFGSQQPFVNTYFATELGPTALTALVSLVLSLGRGPATLAHEHSHVDVPDQRTFPPISASQGTPGQ